MPLLQIHTSKSQALVLHNGTIFEDEAFKATMKSKSSQPLSWGPNPLGINFLMREMLVFLSVKKAMKRPYLQANKRLQMKPNLQPADIFFLGFQNLELQENEVLFRSPGCAML